MATATNTETPFMAATRRGQDAFMQVWKDTMYRYFGVMPEPGDQAAIMPPGVPTAEEVVDHAFDYADAMLDIQRAYVKGVLAANKSVNTLAAWMSQGADKGANTKKS